MSLNNINNISANVWRKRVGSVKHSNKCTGSSNTKKSKKMDTFEMSSLTTKGKTNFKVTPEINKEKADIVSQLSKSHSDVNRFLEIKAQVRAGKYELDAKSIAESVMPYLDYDIKA